MRKNDKLLWFVCALGMFAMSCDEDNNSSDSNGGCQTPGSVKCNGVCIDPMTSNSYCGANEYCENYEICKDTQTCTNGRCRTTTCEPDEHRYNDVCEKDSLDHCGEHGFACASKVEGWKSGTCTDGQCKVQQCIDGYRVDTNTFVCELEKDVDCGSDEHKYNDACEKDSLDHCGEHGFACASKVDGWKSGTCTDGQCKIQQCIEGYRVDASTSVCAPDDEKICGSMATNCTELYWWDGGTCVSGICVPNACKGDYHLAQNNEGVNWCEPDSNQNCGSHGHACENDLQCASGRCLGEIVCDDIKHNIYDDLEHCGECNHRCNDGQICDRGQCQSGKGEMFCNNVIINSNNDSAHCDGCGKVCPVGSYCHNGHCTEGMDITYCSAVKININNDSANCGQCSKACNTEQICNNGNCTTGIGATYCNGVKTDTSTDSANCGRCQKACTSGKSCKDGVCTMIEVEYSVGDTIEFGHYEQDNDTSNGKDPIEWRILDINSAGQFLIITEKVLDVKPYNTTKIDITWEKSTIRSWLNGYGASYNTVGTSFTNDNFINTAFTATERAKIVTSNVIGHPNPNYSTSPGNDTSDKIFLLSITEANQYFTSDDDRKSMATLYANNNGVYSYNYDISSKCTTTNYQVSKCSAYWRLRSPGGTTVDAAYVNSDGGVHCGGDNVDSDDLGVRPALWVQW